MSRTALCLVTLLLIACGNRSPAPSAEPEPTPSGDEAEPAAEPDPEPEPEPTPGPEVEATPEGSARFAAASNGFAIDLFQRLRSTPGNLAFSPASATIALSMTYGGARGATAEQMARVLHIDSPDGFHEAAGGVLSEWRSGSEEGATLRVANRLFGEQTYTFEAPFLELTRTRYGAPLEPVDFRGAPQPTRVHINSWVAEQTQDRIRDLIPPPGIDDTTRLVLTNAVYFLARWEDEFEQNATRDAAFHRASGDVQVPTMHQRGHFPYFAGDGVALLEMPYVGDQMSMVVLLPDANDGLGAVESSLTLERFDGWVERLAPTELNVALPKVRIAPAQSVELSDNLIAMGMADAFDAGAADFFGIATPPEPGMRLYIAKVFHKAFVEIDERGTEAAAATAVVMGRGAGVPQPVPSFTADHPFLFFIRDRRSGTILFVGRVADPADRGAE